MQTIGRHWPRNAPRGDYPAMCDYCGVMWRRSQLRRDAAGRLVCPDEGDGRDAVTLAEENIAAATQRLDRMPMDGGNVDRDGRHVDGDPLDLFGAYVYAWYRADLAKTDDDGRVAVLRDRGHHGRDLYQDSAQLRPDFTTLGGKVALNFNGATWLQGRVAQDWDILYRGAGVTMALVATSSVVAHVFGNAWIGVFRGGGIGVSDATGFGVYTGAPGISYVAQTADKGATKKVIQRSEEAVGSGTLAVDVRVNGVDKATANVAKVTATSSAPRQAAVLGGKESSPGSAAISGVQCVVAELLVVSRRITDAEADQLEAYLGRYS